MVFIYLEKLLRNPCFSTNLNHLCVTHYCLSEHGFRFFHHLHLTYKIYMVNRKLNRRLNMQYSYSWEVQVAEWLQDHWFLTASQTPLIWCLLSNLKYKVYKHIPKARVFHMWVHYICGLTFPCWSDSHNMAENLRKRRWTPKTLGAIVIVW